MEKADGNLKHHIDDLAACVTEIDAAAGPLAEAAKSDASQLGHKEYVLIGMIQQHLNPINNSELFLRIYGSQI